MNKRIGTLLVSLVLLAAAKVGSGIVWPSPIPPWWDPCPTLKPCRQPTPTPRPCHPHGNTSPCTAPTPGPQQG